METVCGNGEYLPRVGCVGACEAPVRLGVWSCLMLGWVVGLYLNVLLTMASEVEAVVGPKCVPKWIDLGLEEGADVDGLW